MRSIPFKKIVASASFFLLCYMGLFIIGGFLVVFGGLPPLSLYIGAGCIAAYLTYVVMIKPISTTNPMVDNVIIGLGLFSVLVI